VTHVTSRSAALPPVLHKKPAQLPVRSGQQRRAAAAKATRAFSFASVRHSSVGQVLKKSAHSGAACITQAQRMQKQASPTQEEGMRERRKE